MSRKRYVRSELGSDERIERLSCGPGGLDLVAAISGLLWPNLLCAMDDWGIFEGSARDVRLKVIPAWPVTNTQVDEALERLRAAELILRHTENSGKQFIAVRNLEAWFKTQSYIPEWKRQPDVARKRPWIPAEHLAWYQQRTTPQVAAEQRTTPQVAAVERNTAQHRATEPETEEPMPETPQVAAEQRTAALCAPSPSPSPSPSPTSTPPSHPGELTSLRELSSPERKRKASTRPRSAREAPPAGPASQRPLNASQQRVARLNAVYAGFDLEPLTASILQMLLAEAGGDVDVAAKKLNEVGGQDPRKLTDVPYLMACMRNANGRCRGLTAPGLTAGADDKRRTQAEQLERDSRES